MLQITFLALGLSGLLFAIAYFFKKYQRGILWAAALILFIGTSLMLGLGLIKIVENGEANHLAVFSVILSFACSGIFACGAEKIHEASLKKASLSLSETQGKEPHEEATPEQELSKMEEIPNDNKDVCIPAKLDTPLARQVFQKALNAILWRLITVTINGKALKYSWHTCVVVFIAKTSPSMMKGKVKHIGDSDGQSSFLILN